MHVRCMHPRGYYSRGLEFRGCCHELSVVSQSSPTLLVVRGMWVKLQIFCHTVWALRQYSFGTAFICRLCRGQRFVVL